jgi:CBS domain-containing protein
MLVKDIMIKDVITLKKDDTLKEVVKKFSKHDISGAPVVDNKKNVVGILSETDILNSIKSQSTDVELVYTSPPVMEILGLRFIETAKDKETEEIFEEIGSIKVSEMMRSNVKTVESEEHIREVIKIVSSGQINRVPVLEDGKLVGIVTRGDIVKHLSELLS